ncbi:MAG: prolipoprotein diacylglyceryl transferase [Lachnospiraceae bacterium]|nr:prolipoprotein diacylglyceryl transferase [Lachnospiraceae bacterium]
MSMYLDFGLFKIPAYGTMIATGVIVANIIVILLILLRDHKDIWDFVILEGFGLLGGIIGSKLLYIIVSFDDIPWDRIGEPEVLATLIGGGFVFYGGLILAVIMVFIGAHFNKIDAWDYLSNYAFAIPLAHGFGRIGCFLAGCCYGVPYHGPLAVVFPESSIIAPPGIELFPVQIVEACCLFVISIILFLFYWFRKTNYLLPMYFILYGIVRFVLEYYRFDEYRGKFLSLYTSQWISIGMIAFGIGWIIYFVVKKYKKEPDENKPEENDSEE